MKIFRPYKGPTLQIPGTSLFRLERARADINNTLRLVRDSNPVTNTRGSGVLLVGFYKPGKALLTMPNLQPLKKEPQP